MRRVTTVSYLHPYFSIEEMRKPQERSNLWKPLEILISPDAKFSIENKKDTDNPLRTKTLWSVWKYHPHRNKQVHRFAKQVNVLVSIHRKS